MNLQSILSKALTLPYQCSHSLLGSQSQVFEVEGVKYYTKCVAENSYDVYRLHVKKTKTSNPEAKTKKGREEKEVIIEKWENIGTIKHYANG